MLAGKGRWRLVQSDDDQPVATDDEEDPSQRIRSTPAFAWWVGAVLPAAIVAYGLYALRSGSAWFVVYRGECWSWSDFRFISRYGFVSFQGPAATGLSIAYISLGVLLHCYVFWSWRDRWAIYAKIGMWVAAIVALEGAWYCMVYALAPA